MIKKIISIFIILSVLFAGLENFPTFGDAPTPTPSPAPDNSSAVQSLEQQITSLEQKITDLQGQEKTLKSQIAVMDSQIQLTQLRINDIQQKIMNLTLDISTATDKINNLQNSINNLTAILLNKIVATYEIGSTQPFQTLISSTDVSNFFTRANYLKIAQAHDKRLAYDTVQAKNDYSNIKNIYESEKKQIEELKLQLQAYTDELNQEKSTKQSLLSQTQGDEASYQSQLAQAQAQLSAFSNFVSAQGGASLLSNQTSCGSWGCYYNQRDSQWGNNVVNGSSDCGGGCTLAKIGCLITSIAMVASHNGHKDILPSDIASSGGDNFAVGTAMLRYGITVKGVSINRSRIGSSSGSLPSTITDPIIVGISYDGGPLPDHFVVLTGGSGGNYIMNDPFVPNGNGVSFTSHYSLSSIVEVDSISM